MAFYTWKNSPDAGRKLDNHRLSMKQKKEEREHFQKRENFQLSDDEYETSAAEKQKKEKCNNVHVSVNNSGVVSLKCILNP